MSTQPNTDQVGYHSYPNEAHSDRWKVTISDVPGYEGEMILFDGYVKGVTLPSLSGGMQDSVLTRIHRDMLQPNGNAELYDLSLTMTISEGYENWAYLARWWKQVAFGLYEEGNLKDRKIAVVRATFLDNQKRPKMVLEFRTLSLSSLSAPQATAGTDEIQQVDVGLKAQELHITLLGEDGKEIFTV